MLFQIEGISDELMLVFMSLAFFALVIFIVTQKYFANARLNVIHPDSEGSVNYARSPRNRDSFWTSMSEWLGTRSETDRSLDEAFITGSTGQSFSCPICQEASAHFGVKTNCGHSFCGHCLLLVWQHGSFMNSIKCPLCRSSVTMILFAFTSDDVNNVESETAKRVISGVKCYNRRFSGRATLLERARDLPIILSHIWHDLLTPVGLRWLMQCRFVFVLLLTLLYLLSPFDIIPEGVFGVLGLLDDILVVALLLLFIVNAYRQTHH